MLRNALVLAGLLVLSTSAFAQSPEIDTPLLAAPANQREGAMVDAYAVAKVLWQAAPGAQISLVPNGVRNDAEGRQAFRQIDRAVVRFLGHNLGYLGSVPDDPAVRDAVSQQRALLDHVPGAPASRSLRLIATRLATLSAAPGGLRLVPRDGDPIDPEVWRCA